MRKKARAALMLHALFFDAIIFAIFHLLHFHLPFPIISFPRAAPIFHFHYYARRGKDGAYEKNIFDYAREREKDAAL